MIPGWGHTSYTLDKAIETCATSYLHAGYLYRPEIFGST